MAKYLGDLQIWAKEESDTQVFGCSANFLESLYRCCLPKVETGGIVKVVIVPCRVLPPNPFEMLINPDIWTISRLFDFEGYSKADEPTQRSMALELIHQSLLQVARIRRWKRKPLMEAHASVLKHNFVHYAAWSKPIANPTRTLKAQVWCNFTSKKAEIFVTIFKRKKIIQKKPCPYY